MRLLLLAVFLACGVARAQPSASPVRVSIQCEQSGRTKACPAFLLGIVDANKVLLASPRAGADVLVYVTANQVALIDRLHLRFVGQFAGAPPVVELDVDLDTRGTDDEQRAQLEPAFLRGLGWFVAARYPGAVKTVLSTPAEVATAKEEGSPWGLMIETGANGSYTERYQSANGHLNIIGRWLTRERRAFAGVFSRAGLNRQPPLTLDDGTVVSLDSESWFVRAGAEYVHLLNECWSIGVGSYTNFEDPKGQHDFYNRSRVAIEWDRFAADDPRGNRLGIFYHLGWSTERYHLPNELGETFATYPVHGINAVGSLRHDTITLGLSLESDAQLDHPTRRHSITLSPFVEVKLGDHVDLSLSLQLTERQLPAPDMNAIDPSDYAQLSRLSYAEPLSIGGSLNLLFHWDPSNGARNNRIESI